MARFYVYRDEQGVYRWRFETSRNKFVADSALGYRSKRECLNAIKTVMKEITRAEVEKASPEIII